MIQLIGQLSTPQEVTLWRVVFFYPQKKRQQSSCFAQVTKIKSWCWGRKVYQNHVDTFSLSLRTFLSHALGQGWAENFCVGGRFIIFMSRYLSTSSRVCLVNGADNMRRRQKKIPQRKFLRLTPFAGSLQGFPVTTSVIYPPHAIARQNIGKEIFSSFWMNYLMISGNAEILSGTLISNPCWIKMVNIEKSLLGIFNVLSSEKPILQDIPYPRGRGIWLGWMLVWSRTSG